MTDLQIEERTGALEILINLEQSGAVDAISLSLTDPDMPYAKWEDVGRFLGTLDRRARWYIGDWLLFGEAVYGEESAQAVEATVSDRYDLAERVTGLDHGTLMNIRSVCARVLRRQRREELGFWIHAEVAKLEPDLQEEWLQRAIDEGWNRDALRAAIRLDLNPPPEDEGDPVGGGAPEGPTLSERLTVAAQLVWQAAQPTADGAFLVPPEPMQMLAEALGEERA